MKIQLTSDTHGHHNQLVIEEDVDMIIHAGDSTNYFDPTMNHKEFHDFITWWELLDVKYKLLIAGNHDAWALKQYNKDRVKESGIYLEHSEVEIEGIKIFGSPYTPTFGNWYFNINRSKISRYWEVIPDGLDILVTHGPPKNILDLTYNQSNKLESVGDSALLKVVEKKQPKYHVFGHVHDDKDLKNYGSRKINGIETEFLNVSAVKDGRFDLGIINHGQIIEIKSGQKLLI